MRRIYTILAVAIVLTAGAAVGAARAAEEKAVVAGGCFWCVEADFESVKGVKSVISGYTGGKVQNPSYKQVSAGGTGHYEAVEISFDNSVISYHDLIAMFLRSVDVTDAGGQFCDRGDSYRTAIFARGGEQQAAAEQAVAEAQVALGQKIVTPVVKAGRFWPAEEYHQNYYRSSDIVLTRAGPKQKKKAYKFYRKACGRDARVRALWGEMAFRHP
ncbi:peptide-methionine (S)-S-oxide reductase [Gemmobacter lutimaris]|uniref:Peptide methionine sulfoxide reductase MsrA n=1 Tax=Gemmobacter lutimaris TaxID=2306023 RepID=A0A398BPN7_9RHOB|nr:peptide-methionine (S)-S-oxide reductase MsrA [Gemmobacter lutimaris]RID90871.1 peptide-methionine (S)-S-oxide reductase [Gemmobacter lutimaris]